MSEDGVGAKRLVAYLAEKKSLAIIIAALLIGACLMIFGGSGTERETVSANVIDTDALEEKVASLCEQVAGVGKARVMITVDTVSEQLYAKNSQYTSDVAKTEYVTTSQGLMPIGERAMTVRGVAVVCGGGDLADVKLKLTELICALFDIGADRVSIVGGK